MKNDLTNTGASKFPLLPSPSHQIQARSNQPAVVTQGQGKGTGDILDIEIANPKLLRCCWVHNVKKAMDKMMMRTR